MSNTSETFSPSSSSDFPWECACGERFRLAIKAIRCRKCRVYVPDASPVALNLETGEELTVLDFRLDGSRR
jgi:uncharacterized protein (UPF0179 family)